MSDTGSVRGNEFVRRILALGSGVSMYSITMIVGAFMAGLGLGSQLGGDDAALNHVGVTSWVAVAFQPE